MLLNDLNFLHLDNYKNYKIVEIAKKYLFIALTIEMIIWRFHSFIEFQSTCKHYFSDFLHCTVFHFSLIIVRKSTKSLLDSISTVSASQIYYGDKILILLIKNAHMGYLHMQTDNKNARENSLYCDSWGIILKHYLFISRMRISFHMWCYFLKHLNKWNGIGGLRDFLKLRFSISYQLWNNVNQSLYFIFLWNVES